MRAARGPARVPRSPRAPRAFTAIVLAGVLLAAVCAQAKASPSLAEKRAEASRVEAQITVFEARLERRIEAYDHVHQQLVDTRARLQRTRRLLAISRSNLRSAQRRLAQSLIRSYKGGDPDVIGYLLAARSINDLVDQMQALNTANSMNSDLLGTITRLRAQIGRRETALEHQTAVLAREQARQQAAKEAVQQGLAEHRHLLAGINADIQRIIVARQRAAAAAAARAAAEAQQQAAAAAASASQSSDASSSSSGSVDVPVPPGSSIGAQAAALAQRYLGVPYQWGGESPSGFDCSGLVAYVYGRLGVSLPHYAAAQYSAGPHVPRDALEPGDLVFFDSLGHVGIYIGGNAFVHAPHTGDVVRISTISGWYAETYAGATRIG